MNNAVVNSTVHSANGIFTKLTKGG